MPGPSTTTITAGKAGTGATVSNLVITGVTDIDFRLANSILQVTANGKISEFDIAATATLTATISSGVMSLTVNQ